MEKPHKESEVIRIGKKGDTLLEGTEMLLAVMNVLSEAGIDRPGNFGFENPDGNVISMEVSHRVAGVLRANLPRKGYYVLKNESAEPDG